MNTNDLPIPSFEIHIIEDNVFYREPKCFRSQIKMGDKETHIQTEFGKDRKGALIDHLNKQNWVILHGIETYKEEHEKN